MLTGFRGIKGGTIERLVQITALVVPEGEPPWSPSLTARLPPEQIGMFRRGDTMADGIDIDIEEPHASISVGFAGDDGSITTVSWTITSESRGQCHRPDPGAARRADGGVHRPQCGSVP